MSLSILSETTRLALSAILATTNIKRNATHHFGIPRARHESAPVRTTATNIGFLHPFLSEYEPMIGPTTNMINVARAVPMDQYDRYCVSESPSAAAKSLKYIGNKDAASKTNAELATS